MKLNFSQMDPAKVLLVASGLFACGTVVFLIAILIPDLQLHPVPRSNPTLQSATTSQAMPGMTDEEKSMLQAQSTFQELVSYTGNGFEPVGLTVKVGDVIRFTNNSQADIWLGSKWGDGRQDYPGSVPCGQGPIDTCAPLGRGDFYQFKVEYPGTYEVQNNLDLTKIMTIEAL